jgi:hypothetical protein
VGRTVVSSHGEVQAAERTVVSARVSADACERAHKAPNRAPIRAPNSDAQ